MKTFSINIIGLFLLLALSSRVVAWEKEYPRPYSGWAQGVVDTHDGGFAVVGTQYYLGGFFSNATLMKIDAGGNEIFIHGYGEGDVNLGEAIVKTSENGFALVGTTFGKSGPDIFLIITDKDGGQLSSRTFGGKAPEHGSDVAITSDGGFIILGETASFGNGKEDIYLIKTDAFGEKLWERTFGTASSEIGGSVFQTEDGGFMAAGHRESGGDNNADILIIRTDPSGNLLWEKVFETEGDQRAGSIIGGDAGGAIIVGTNRRNTRGKSAMYLLAIDSSGNVLWERNFGAEFNAKGFAVTGTRDNGYAAAGNIWLRGKSGTSAIYLMKTDKGGNPAGKRFFAADSYAYAFAYDVIQTMDGGFVIAGKVNLKGDDNMYLIRTDESEEKSE